MPRVSLTVTEVNHDGVAYPTPDASVPASDEEIEDNDGRIIVIMENVSGSTRTVVIECAATYGEPPIPLTDRTITLLTTEKKVAGAFSQRLFNQAGDGSTQSVLINVDGSDGDVEFVCLKVPIPTA